MTEADIPRLRELQDGYEWPIGPDFMGGWCVEEDGKIVAIVGAWGRAETHLVMDKSWKTPADRLAVVGQMHEEIAPQLKAQGVGEVITFFDTASRFCTRIGALGWQKIKRAAWGRKL